MDRFTFSVTLIMLTMVTASCGKNSASDARDSKHIVTHTDIEKFENHAYNIYFMGNPERAEDALLQLIRYLDGLPSDKSYQVARYSGRMYALVRLQFIRAYKQNTPMDFRNAV